MRRPKAGTAAPAAPALRRSSVAAAVEKAVRGVLASLRGLGLTPKRHEQAKYPPLVCGRAPDWLVDRVFEVPGVAGVVAVVDPFDDAERRRWLRGFTVDERYRMSLRIDTLLFDWPTAARLRAEWDYGVAVDVGGDTGAEVARFLAESGLGVSRLDVERDAKFLLGGAFTRFSGLDG